ncbi:hypothetical protein EVAR_50033_1 [Eumeta japonica]|uniref:Uncharacterized protein n=1 Tax=Eumeta variegata TaxID=151549 RepID=A0A4C1XLB9_EUMVA|nr:hypothetical protein EVAR_50033_1 [Eumeta japonica]
MSGTARPSSEVPYPLLPAPGWMSAVSRETSSRKIYSLEVCLYVDIRSFKLRSYTEVKDGRILHVINNPFYRSRQKEAVKPPSTCKLHPRETVSRVFKRKAKLPAAQRGAGGARGRSQRPARDACVLLNRWAGGSRMSYLAPLASLPARREIGPAQGSAGLA